MNNTLFIGDSHILHAFNIPENSILYIKDVTLNQIRKGNGDININFLERSAGNTYDTYEVVSQGTSLIEFINNSSYDNVVISIGEIDIRFHLVKQLEKDKEAVIKIHNIYKDFLLKLNKRVVVVSIPPPGISTVTEYTKRIDERKEITKEINFLRKELCNINNFLYFDYYTDYHINGILNSEKSDGQVHINTKHIPDCIDKLNILLQNKQ